VKREEAIMKKAELRNKIRDLVEDFEEETGFRVETLSITGSGAIYIHMEPSTDGRETNRKFYKEIGETFNKRDDDRCDKMRLRVKRDCLEIWVENDQDLAFLEDTLGAKDDDELYCKYNSFEAEEGSMLHWLEIRKKKK